jgi:hypothetical protein
MWKKNEWEIDSGMWWWPWQCHLVLTTGDYSDLCYKPHSSRRRPPLRPSAIVTEITELKEQSRYH